MVISAIWEILWFARRKVIYLSLLLVVCLRLFSKLVAPMILISLQMLSSFSVCCQDRLLSPMVWPGLSTSTSGLFSLQRWDDVTLIMPFFWTHLLSRIFSVQSMFNTIVHHHAVVQLGFSMFIKNDTVPKLHDQSLCTRITPTGWCSIQRRCEMRSTFRSFISLLVAYKVMIFWRPVQRQRSAHEKHCLPKFEVKAPEAGGQTVGWAHEG